MSIKKIAVYQSGAWSTQDIGADAANITVNGGADGDLMYVNNGTLAHSSQVKLDNLTGLTGNVQTQLNTLNSNLGKYATTSALASYALASSVSSYYALKSTLSNFAKLTDYKATTANVANLQSSVASLATNTGNSNLSFSTYIGKCPISIPTTAKACIFTGAITDLSSTYCLSGAFFCSIYHSLSSSVAQASTHKYRFFYDGEYLKGTATNFHGATANCLFLG